LLWPRALRPYDGAVKDSRELENRFSWSSGRQRGFDTCRRQYYYSYYGHWNGWKDDADPMARAAYRLKKLQTLDMLTGQVIHAAIERGLRGLRTGTPLNPDRLREDAVEAFRKAWRQSRNGSWRTDPKHCANLFEHYYEVPVPAGRTDGLRDKIADCLRHFCQSDEVAAIRASDRSGWRALEELESFPLDGFPVFVKVDFAYLCEGVLRICDWKSGKPAPDDVGQLQVYALYATERWQAPVERILTVAAYLRDGQFREHPVAAGELLDARDRILTGAAAMRALLEDPETNTAAMEKFEKTGEGQVCRLCNFREICRPEEFPRPTRSVRDDPAKEGAS